MTKTDNQQNETPELGETAALQDRIRELEAENARLRGNETAGATEGPGGPIHTHSQSVGHDAGIDEWGQEIPAKKVKQWPFRVRVKRTSHSRNGKPIQHDELQKLLPPEVIEACDEGEAIRLYALRHKDPFDEKSQTMVTVNFDFEASCTDPEREKRRRQKYIDAGYGEAGDRTKEPIPAGS